MTVDPEIPVPPRYYGGIERIVFMLVRGLIQRGHQITLFAHPDSEVPCRLEPYPGRRSRSTADLLRNMWHVSSKIFRKGYDLVHSFGRLSYLLPLLPMSFPKVMSYQRHVTARSVRWGDRLSRRTLHFVGLSEYVAQSYKGRENWDVIYNGAPLETYQLREKVEKDAPLVFLGQINEPKGVHLAIEVALRSCRKLVIAGNLESSPKHRLYFERMVKPYINGREIRYLGPVTDREKNEILGQASALLMPVLWEEPFGIVMAEALACGTPVIGLNRGAVPEVVENGVNGFVCETVDEMVSAVEKVGTIGRRRCREIMEEKFSDRAVVEAYEKLYQKLVQPRPH